MFKREKPSGKGTTGESRKRKAASAASVDAEGNSCSSEALQEFKESHEAPVLCVSSNSQLEEAVEGEPEGPLQDVQEKGLGAGPQVRPENLSNTSRADDVNADMDETKEMAERGQHQHQHQHRGEGPRDKAGVEMTEAKEYQTRLQAIGMGLKLNCKSQTGSTPQYCPPSSLVGPRSALPIPGKGGERSV